MNDLTPELARRMRTQVDTWRRDLVAVDRRQRLVYFKHTKVGSLEIVAPTTRTLLGALTGPLRLVSAEDGAAKTVQVADKTAEEVAASARRLDNESQKTYADRGVWTLYAGLGILEWVDKDGKRCEAPLVLMPVRLQRSGAQAPYFISRYEDEDLIVNPALRLLMEREFDIDLPDVDADDVDVSVFFSHVSVLVSSQPGWAVRLRTVLTTFSFHKEPIYRDLAEHEANVLGHPVVQLVALGADAPSSARFHFETPGSEHPIDAVPPEEMHSILDADSSQRLCILAAREGRSFVMDGPPGTGKSQTIANIIAELIADGKRVLFVSEKAAALDVVRDRLTAQHLGEFLMELHSHKATRKAVVKQLDDAVRLRVKPGEQTTAQERAALVQSREELSDHARAMNETRPKLGRSVYDALGRVMQLSSHTLRALDMEPRWTDMDAASFNRLLSVAERLQNAWRPAAEGADFLWRDPAKCQHTTAELESAKDAVVRAGRAAAQLRDRIRAVDHALLLSWPVDLAGAQRRARLLEVLSRRPGVPDAWLSMQEDTALRARVDVLRTAVGEYHDARGSLAEIVGESAVEALDPDQTAPVRVLVEKSVVWRPNPDTTTSQVNAALQALTSSAQALADIVVLARRLGSMLGVDTEQVSVRRSAELAELALLGGRVALPERAWLNPAVQSALDESMRVLSLLVGVVNDRRAAMQTVFKPEALDADLQSLDIRFKQAHGGFRAWGSAARTDRKALKALTVSGKADKGIRARLEEAVAWQTAERQLTSAEGVHAGRLGGYYDHAATDFGRVSNAIATARRAIELAGNDLNDRQLGDQIGAHGSPDPQLILVATQITELIGAWESSLREAVGAESLSELAHLPMEVSAARSLDAGEAFGPLLAGMQHVASVSGRDVTLKVARVAQDEASRLAVATVAVLDSYDADVDLLGGSYTGLTTDWPVIDHQVAWWAEFRTELGAAATPRQLQALASPLISTEEVRASIGQWETERAGAVDLFSPERAADLARDLDSDLDQAGELLQEMQDSCHADLQEWDAHTQARGILEQEGLAPLVTELVDARAGAGQVRAAIERGLLQAWVDATIAQDRRLGTTRALDRDVAVARYRHQDRDLIARANAAVAHACNIRRPSSMAGKATQLIRREAEKKTRHLPIRELLAKTGEIAQDLKPCFMMSPLSVSQFLPGTMTFDVVIFDEASQVLPSDAVNCIYRAEQLIVAGDEKQLPPTSFFSASVDEEDIDEELDVFESVLKSCKSALPSLPLTWHYRSQHESLITYSNHRFYTPDGQALQTFPSATFQSQDLGVESFVVNGEYRKGTSRDNPVEARAVVDRVLFHREHHPELSVGVVTFSAAQERAVSTALEERAVTEPLIAELLDDHDRLSGFFVKNLENVQGDERDLIIFSVGYGPDATGTFSMNFGPVTRAGGWRRLNVAVTRARRRVEVIASFRAAQMREGSNESLAALKGYLEFAERGGQLSAATTSERPSAGQASVAEDVAAALEGLGYVVERQHGAAGYRLDLAVMHPDRPGEYLMAVECDGPSYDSAATARDRDRLRAEVLTRLGWNTYRVWSIAWLRDRSTELKRLQRRLEEARQGLPQAIAAAFQKAPPATVEIHEVDHNELPDWAQRYQHWSNTSSTWADLGSIEARPQLQSYLKDLLVCEAPLHRDLVFKRVRDAFGVGRVGVNIKDNIDFVVRRLQVDGHQGRIDDHGFYRLGEATAVRAPSSQVSRTVQQVPAEEMDLAVRHLVADARSVDEEDLVRAVARVFGWQRAGADIQAAVLGALDRMEADGSVVRSGDGSLTARR